jgi:hypothetical protein
VTRFHAWSALSDRRVTCPGGHSWSPGALVRSGHAEVMCQQCRTPLIVVAWPALGQRLTLACSRSEWEELTARGLSADVAALWLVTHAAAA